MENRSWRDQSRYFISGEVTNESGVREWINILTHYKRDFCYSIALAMVESKDSIGRCLWNSVMIQEEGSDFYRSTVALFNSSDERKRKVEGSKDWGTKLRSEGKEALQEQEEETEKVVA